MTIPGVQSGGKTTNVNATKQPKPSSPQTSGSNWLSRIATPRTIPDDQAREGGNGDFGGSNNARIQHRTINNLLDDLDRRPAGRVLVDGQIVASWLQVGCKFNASNALKSLKMRWVNVASWLQDESEEKE